MILRAGGRRWQQHDLLFKDFAEIGRTEPGSGWQSRTSECRGVRWGKPKKQRSDKNKQEEREGQPNAFFN